MNSDHPRTIVPVLCYHGIGDDARDGTPRWTVSPGDFEEQMALLAAQERKSLTVSEYAAALRDRVRLPPRPVLITFDDGFADLVTTALPVLSRYGVRATAYVITSTLGTAPARGARPALDWDQLVELGASDVEVGSHSHTHRALDCLSRTESLREITQSKRILEDALGRPVSSFAYPYGYHNSFVRRQVAAAAYTSACGVKNALSHPGDDVFAIARVLVERGMGAEVIEALLDGRGWPLAWSGERVRTRAWRVYRRTRHLARSARPEPVASESSEARW